MINKLVGMLGLILGVTAGVTASLYPAKVLLNASLTGCSLILLIIFFIIHFDAFKAFSKKRSTRLGLNSMLMIGLFVFIAVVLNLMARQYYIRLDLSAMSRYSIAPQTVNVIRGLESGIKITVFGKENTPTFKKAKDLLEGYRYLNRNIIFSVVDLDREPILAGRYGVGQYDSVVVSGEGEAVVAQGINEETITNAIIKATRKDHKKIYFVRGHGEHDIEDNGRKGMSKAGDRLRSIGYEVEPLTLFSVDAVPGDADLLIITGPEEVLSDEDIKKVNKYMEEGGKLAAFFEPGYDASFISGRTAIRLNDVLVIDPSSNLGGMDERIPLVSSYPDSPVTRNFNLSTVYPGAASLTVGGLDRVYKYTVIVSTSPESRLLKGDKVINEDGGYTLAAFASSKKGEDITIVFGDSDFASNAFFDVAGNGNLFLNSINWIAEEGGLISIAPRKDNFIPLYLTPEQGRFIMYVSVAGIPLSVFGAGLFIWWRRRRL